jgi:hypothetical protein
MNSAKSEINISRMMYTSALFARIVIQFSNAAKSMSTFAAQLVALICHLRASITQVSSTFSRKYAIKGLSPSKQTHLMTLKPISRRAWSFSNPLGFIRIEARKNDKIWRKL